MVETAGNRGFEALVAGAIKAGDQHHQGVDLSELDAHLLRLRRDVLDGLAAIYAHHLILLPVLQDLQQRMDQRQRQVPLRHPLIHLRGSVE